MGAAVDPDELKPAEVLQPFSRASALLAVDDGGRGDGLTAGCSTKAWPISAPAPPRGWSLREIMQTIRRKRAWRQVTTQTMGLVQIEDSVHRRAHVRLARPNFGLGNARGQRSYSARFGT
jgi:hypothetical protein